MTRLPAGLCTTEALQKWLATPESVRYSTPAAGVPPNAWPLGELTGCSGVSTAEPGPAAVVAPAAAPRLLVGGAGATGPRRARARFRSRMRCCLRATRERPPGASIDASLRSRPASGRLAFHDECRLRRRLRSAEPFTTRSTQIPALAEPRIR